jgi:hypothetical protein
MKSISDLDEVDKWHGEGSAYQKALGEDFAKTNREFAANGLMSVESNMFAISPTMSYVSEEVAKDSPNFWNPKTTSVAASKKKGKEEAAGN